MGFAPPSAVPDTFVVLDASVSPAGPSKERRSLYGIEVQYQR